MNERMNEVNNNRKFTRMWLKGIPVDCSLIQFPGFLCRYSFIIFSPVMFSII